jgi:xylulokinase
MGLYLGFDSSTQSLTATVIEIRGDSRRIVFEHALGIRCGISRIRHRARRRLAAAGDGRGAPAMWAAALDRMMGVIAAQGLDITRIRAISGAGQQHGSVYLLAGAERTLAQLDHHRPLVEQNRTAAGASGLPRLARLQHHCRVPRAGIGGWR